MEPEIIGWRLARERRASGLTQVQVAEAMGTTQSVVARIESGRTRPSLVAIERYANAVGRPITFTFGEGKPEEATRTLRRERVRRALGDFRFDPWDREPSEAEARTLIADGLVRDRG